MFSLIEYNPVAAAVQPLSLPPLKFNKRKIHPRLLTTRPTPSAIYFTGTRELPRLRLLTF